MDVLTNDVLSTTEVGDDIPCQCCCPTGTVQIIIPNHPIDEITHSILEWNYLRLWPIQIPRGVQGNRIEYSAFETLHGCL